jgi:hypothetical protein
MRALLLLGLGIATQLGSALLLATSIGERWLGADAVAAGAQCAQGEGAIGLPLLAATTWLLLRSFPLRARLASALAGGAAGVLADAAWHLVCTRTDLLHILIWHLGATVALTAAGYLVGVYLERRF